MEVPETLTTTAAAHALLRVLEAVDHTQRDHLGPGERLELVDTFTQITRRVDALRATLIAEAEAQNAARAVTGAPMNTYLARNGTLSPAQATGEVFTARDLTATATVQAAALAGRIDRSQARGIGQAMRNLPAGLGPQQRQAVEAELLVRARTRPGEVLAREGLDALHAACPEALDNQTEAQHLERRAFRAHQARALRFLPEKDGSIEFSGSLPVIEGTWFRHLIGHHTEAARRINPTGKNSYGHGHTPQQRNADALITLLKDAHANHPAAAPPGSPQPASASVPDRWPAVESLGGPQPAASVPDRRPTAGPLGGPQSAAASVPDRWPAAEPLGGPQLAASVPDQWSADGPLGGPRSAAASVPDWWPADGPAATTTPASPATAAAATASAGHESQGRGPDPMAGLGSAAAGSPVGVRGVVSCERARIVVTINEADLKDRCVRAGILADGTKIPASQLRRLACEADILPVVLGTHSEILDVGRTARLVTPGIRRALSVRDKGCIFPNCDAPDHRCQAHHVIPFHQGGTTALTNLVLLCPYHHALIEPPPPQPGLPPPTTWNITFDTRGNPHITPPQALHPPRRIAPLPARLVE